MFTSGGWDLLSVTSQIGPNSKPTLSPKHLKAPGVSGCHPNTAELLRKSKKELPKNPRFLRQSHRLLLGTLGDLISSTPCRGAAARSSATGRDCQVGILNVLVQAEKRLVHPASHRSVLRREWGDWANARELL